MGPTETEIPITALLTRVSAGDADAAEELMSRLYPDLRRIAARIFRSEWRNQTLQPTALVNEAYLRTFGAATIDWKDRAHFFALMARQIRHVLVERARATDSAKRGAGAIRMALDDVPEPGQEANVVAHLAVSEALDALALEAPRAARVVELRHFGGLTESEVAEVLGISMPTVTRDWRFARAWLLDRLGTP